MTEKATAQLDYIDRMISNMVGGLEDYPTEEIYAALKALEGVTQDALDGGWTAKGLMAYAKSLEDRPTIYLGRIDRSEGGEAWIELTKNESMNWPDTVRVVQQA